MDELAGEILRFLFAWFVWIGWALIALPWRLWIDNRETRRRLVMRKRAQAAGFAFAPAIDDGSSNAPMPSGEDICPSRDAHPDTDTRANTDANADGYADENGPRSLRLGLSLAGLGGYEPFKLGASRTLCNVLSGRVGGRPFLFGDCCYVTETRMHDLCLAIRRRHFFSWCMVEHPLDQPNVLPQLTIRPEGLADKLKAVAGFEDINFESAAYSRTFYVQAPDRKYAYSVITPQSMELQMTRPTISLHLDDRGVLIVDDLDRFAPDHFIWYRDFGAKFLELIPTYVYEKYAQGGG